MLSHKSTFPARWIALGASLFLTLPAFLSAYAAPRSSEPSGEQIFLKRCASCHGAKGEGAKAHPKPLTGARSVGQLARFIAQSMPPGAARKLAAKDAEKVAAYIHDAFYSPVAQARNKPARVELSRLTVRQYRSAVADLVGSFRARPAGSSPDDRRGLRAEYFKSRRFRGNERVLERVDPEIRFDFGQAAPQTEPPLDPHQFSIRWEGGVLAPETGEYEFIVRTEHATRLWVNDLRQPLIDAWVKSGADNEYRGSLFLLGGRVYPLRLEFSKSKQGVDDSEKLKGMPPAKASLALEWKLPKQVAEVIPQRSLFPQSPPETFVLATPFPPDDRSTGYERGTSVSKEWEQATTEAALEAAAYVAARMSELSGAADDAADREARIRAFCRQFAGRAFRRPLSAELERVFIERQFQEAPDPETVVKRVVLLVLKSPRFLYRELGSGQADGFDVASRLSFGLWDSLPDEDLLRAAAAGELSTREQVVRQAERMVSDPRTRSKLREFFLQWLKVEHYPDLAKDPKRFPGFDPAAASDLRTSLELFLEQVVWSERSDFRELLLTDKVFLNGRLAKLYGADLPAGAPFQVVSLDPSERAGLLTHPYVLASFAYLDTSSPIHRGVLVARSLLGRALQPPPEAFTPLPAELHPKLTTRQRVALQTQPAACMSCHGMINPLGFTLEKFDAIGRLRAQENGMPVDTTGSYQSRTGKAVKFSGVRDLAGFLAGSEEAHAAFVEQLFQHTVKQPAQAFGPTTLPDLQRAFGANQFSIRKQLVETMAVSAMRTAKVEGMKGETGTGARSTSTPVVRPKSP
jgi:mono/diheme cytochrome c family protein